MPSVASALNQGRISQAIAGGGGTYDVQGPSGTNLLHINGRSTLVLLLDLTGTAAPDLSLAVVPYEGDMLTPMTGAPMPVVQSSGPTLVAGHVQMFAQYDVFGLEAVRIRVTNNNAGLQTLSGSWELA